MYYVLFNFTSFLIIFRCFHLFLISSSFLFHFSSFIYFFGISFSFVLQMSLSCVSFVSYYFQFYPYWALVNSPRRPSRPSKLSGKPKSLLNLLLCYFGLQLVNLLYFYPPSHSNLCTGNHPNPKPTTFPGPSPTHPPRGLWE